jgi:hypothetical protein
LVTVSQFNLHTELMALIGHEELAPVESAPTLYAASCRWTSRGKKHYLESWTQPLSIGQTLPTLPLWLAEDLILPLDLEPSYEQACNDLWISEQRSPASAAAQARIIDGHAWMGEDLPQSDRSCNSELGTRI